MCGINGIYNFSKVILSNEDHLISSMNACISHRGPDDKGFWSNKNQGIFFGHQRLSIIDLSASGHQPMISDKGNVIIFNGEIYNYKEIKKKINNFNFKSTSDTEVILYLYEKYGKQCVNFLNGMFAFAIWDQEKQELFIARDRAGKKPFYYTLQNGIFAFSSEVKALLKLPWVKAELDETALYHFLTFNHLAPPATMFKNIFKLEPGALMSVTSKGILNHEIYWEVAYKDLSKKTEQELEEMIFSALSKSVDYRMVSDVPVGAFLSGGVDSSAIVALMSRNASYPVKTYSIGFKDAPDYDELAHAQKVSKIFGTSHYEKIVSPDDIRNFLPKIVDIFDEPLADTTSIPIYFLSQMARENGTVVVLTGDGPDELLLGYRNWIKYIQLYPYYHAYQKLPYGIKKAVSKLFMKEDNSPLSEILERAAKNQEFFWGGAKSFRESTKKEILTDQFNQKMKDVNSYDVIRGYKNDFNKIKNNKPNYDDGDWMSYLGLKFLHPNLYLFRADRLGMAHSIEARMPFLDYEFINLALSIPTSFKLRNKIPKYILKKSLEKILPIEVLYRKKQGFNVPIKEWASEIMLDYVEANLKSFCSRNEVFNYDGLKLQLNNVRKGNKNFSNNLWTVYFLMLWFDKWIN